MLVSLHQKVNLRVYVTSKHLLADVPILDSNQFSVLRRICYSKSDLRLLHILLMITQDLTNISAMSEVSNIRRSYFLFWQNYTITTVEMNSLKVDRVLFIVEFRTQGASISAFTTMSRIFKLSKTSRRVIYAVRWYDELRNKHRKRVHWCFVLWEMLKGRCRCTICDRRSYWEKLVIKVNGHFKIALKHME